MAIKNFAAMLRPATATAEILVPLTNGAKLRINKLTVSNPSAGAILVDVWAVPVGGTPDATNQIITERPVAPKDVETLSELISQILDNGRQLYVKSSVADTGVFLASLTQFVD